MAHTDNPNSNYSVNNALKMNREILPIASVWIRVKMCVNVPVYAVHYPLFIE
jgi:hypothetical protein